MGRCSVIEGKEVVLLLRRIIVCAAHLVRRGRALVYLGEPDLIRLIQRRGIVHSVATTAEAAQKDIFISADRGLHICVAYGLVLEPFRRRKGLIGQTAEGEICRRVDRVPRVRLAGGLIAVGAQGEGYRPRRGQAVGGGQHHPWADQDRGADARPVGAVELEPERGGPVGWDRVLPAAQLGLVAAPLLRQVKDGREGHIADRAVHWGDLSEVAGGLGTARSGAGHRQKRAAQGYGSNPSHGAKGSSGIRPAPSARRRHSSL